jgi:hypothetical protein
MTGIHAKVQQLLMNAASGGAAAASPDHLHDQHGRTAVYLASVLKEWRSDL